MFNGESEIDLVIYGYEIDKDVYFFIKDKLLVNCGKEEFSRLQLRTTMTNFLSYLLSHADKGHISDDELMLNVWEKHNLRASSHRLWQVARDMKKNLKEIGLTQDIFFRAERRGFVVNQKLISPIFQRIQKERVALRPMQIIEMEMEK